MIIVQGLSMDHLIDMIGIEYILDPEICPPACPDVYIFRYFSIHSYYIININIYYY